MCFVSLSAISTIPVIVYSEVINWPALTISFVSKRGVLEVHRRVQRTVSKCQFKFSTKKYSRLIFVY